MCVVRHFSCVKQGGQDWLSNCAGSDGDAVCPRMQVFI